MLDESGDVLINSRAPVFRHLHDRPTIERYKWCYHFLIVENSVTDNFD